MKPEDFETLVGLTLLRLHRQFERVSPFFSSSMPLHRKGEACLKTYDRHVRHH